jgi:BirA family biotin operon repressor/biotin-[acetyl-CoA-carboxylase] ligase
MNAPKKSSGQLAQPDREIDTSLLDSTRNSSGWPFVRTLVAYDVVESTSDVAAALIREGTHELPLAVWARRQTRGRGRGNHQWWSDQGSLTFTLAIDPAAHGLNIDQEPKLALATAVAVIEAVGKLGLESRCIGIRWPNDLEVDGRKLGGILPERLDAANGHRNLIGVGLNVLTNLLDAPADVRMMATSLADLHSEPLAAELPLRLFSAILMHFEVVLGRLAQGDSALACRWNQLDLLRDRWLRVDQGTRIVAGRGQGIDADGALCLDDGRERFRVFGGQVLRPTGFAG